jgi:hypothetical protein
MTGEGEFVLFVLGAVGCAVLWVVSHVRRNLQAPSITRAWLEAQGFHIDKFLTIADGVLAFDHAGGKIAFGPHSRPRILNFADVLEYRTEDIPRGSQVHYQLTLVVRDLDHPTLRMNFLFRHHREDWADTLKVAFDARRRSQGSGSQGER